jgi:glycosyltransferase involved in cell wall biosynthesis
MAHAPTHSSGNAAGRRRTGFTGLFFDEFAPGSAWIRESGRVRLPPLEQAIRLHLRGEFRPHPEARGWERRPPTLTVRIVGGPSCRIEPAGPGPWEAAIEVPAGIAGRGAELRLELGGVAFTNLLAWLGRITGLAALQRFRRQARNRQLRVSGIETGTGEVIYDFSQPLVPYSAAFARRHLRLGLNVVGFLTADLGVGESARCMVRAAEAAQLAVALVPLKLHCKNRLGDQTYAARLQETNPHPINVFHIDAPAAREIDHHHGKSFRAGKRNIGYLAWELPEFPDSWTPCFDCFDEIWCPSDFTAAAIAMKSPLPVLTMPHAISFARPTESIAALRTRLELPADKFLFLTLFDLNSYAERKNPRAVVAAFRQSGLATAGAALVIKVQNAAGNPAEFAALRDSVRDLPGTVLLTGTFSRADIYALEAACDCFVSLHRAEGYGLAVAESMFLGKPVISTDWSATAEFVDETNGCPVRAPLVTLAENHGPYTKGSSWADPDPAHAAEWMKRLHGDRALAARLGAHARETMETRFAPAVIGARYRRRLEAIAGF